MIVDTSVLVAIIRGEPEARVLSMALEEAESASMSAASYLEAGIVIDGSRNPVLSRKLDAIIEDAMIHIEPVTERQARIAREAYRDFGKGSGHAAGLNFGDCFAYALAKDRGEPLLYKGGDFSKTDVRAAAG
ncbi:MAG: type II toxin-antitoxin system VapC family toxin [Bauldia litoralis]